MYSMERGEGLLLLGKKKSRVYVLAGELHYGMTLQVWRISCATSYHVQCPIAALILKPSSGEGRAEVPMDVRALTSVFFPPYRGPERHQ